MTTYTATIPADAAAALVEEVKLLDAQPAPDAYGHSMSTITFDEGTFAQLRSRREGADGYVEPQPTDPSHIWIWIGGSEYTVAAA